MAELNFGLLTPPGSQSVGNAFAQGMDQAQAARLQEQQLQQSMQQNELAKAKMGEYQRGIAEQNALRNRMTQPGFDINNPQHQQEILGIAPVLGQAVLQHAATMQKTGAEIKRLGAQAEASDAARSKDRQQFNDQALRNLAVNPSDDNIRAWGQDAVINKIYAADKAAEVVDRYLSIPLEQRAATFKQAGAAAPTAEVTPPDIRTMRELGYPNTPAGYTSFRDAQRQDRLLTPAEEAQKVRIARESRPLVQPVAPTITQIVDPTDATKMITIDARRYAGGGAGSPGVIGVSGKEPSAALRENKIEAGKTLLADEVSNLRAALNTLNVARAIPSTERGTMSNIASSIAASGVGQVAGRIGGTQAQTERDVIASSKLRLVNAIKQATGMSAQQLNSNVELQTMLKSLSDPSQSIEANIRNLDNIEKSYINATPTAMLRSPTGAPATESKTAPAVGAIQDGYRFNGGDPAKASNWKKVGT